MCGIFILAKMEFVHTDGTLVFKKEYPHIITKIVSEP